MRILSEAELELIAGGDGGDIVVTGPGQPGGVYPGSNSPPSMGNIPGSNVPNPAPAPIPMGYRAVLTPGNMRIVFRGSLSQSQINVMSAIADYGRSHGATNDQIWNAIQQGYHESHLGAFYGTSGDSTQLQSPDSGAHVGLFQYDLKTWATYGDGIDAHRTDNASQIKALYNEILSNFTHERYNSGVASGAIPSNFSYDEYLEYKHHQPQGDGGVTVGQPWNAYQQTYDRDSYGSDGIGIDSVRPFVN